MSKEAENEFLGDVICNYFRIPKTTDRVLEKQRTGTKIELIHIEGSRREILPSEQH